MVSKWLVLHIGRAPLAWRVTDSRLDNRGTPVQLKIALASQAAAALVLLHATCTCLDAPRVLAMHNSRINPFLRPNTLEMA